MSPELLAASHRGRYTYRRRGKRLVGVRGGGGLINAVGAALERTGGTWIAAASSPGDHELARTEPAGRQEDGFVLRLLDLPSETHRLHYEVVSNEYLWFLLHYLFDVHTQPRFDAAFARAWDAYGEINRMYAEALAKAGKADAILIEDYHLMLVGAELRRLRRHRGTPLLYFQHTPWCEPDYFGLLPTQVGVEILAGLLAHDVVGFHARRWADAFLACCDRHLPKASVDAGSVTYRGRTTQVIVAPVPLDAEGVRAEAASAQTEAWMSHIAEERGDRTLLVRVDRLDLSKNALRGFLAFEELLERRPDLAGDVWFLALVYPSRLTVDRYRRYFGDCLEVVERINERFGAGAPGDEGPLGLHFEDDHPRSLAAMRSSDVLLVNPVFDGLNLVAKEGAAINERNGSLILSRNAGVFEELGAAALAVNPFDVTATADAIEQAIDMPTTERKRRASRLRRLATKTAPEDWVRVRLGAAGL